MNNLLLRLTAITLQTVLWLTIAISAVAADSSVADLEDHYQQAKFFYNQLKTTSTLGSSRDNWLKGAANFRRIYLSEPKSELAPACLFMLGRTYYDMFEKFGMGIDLGESISYYRDVDALFPGNRLADDALYAVGIMLLQKVKDPKRAAKTFAKIASDYPEGDMRSQAEAQLKVLSQEYDIPLPGSMLGNAQLLKLTNVLPVKYWSSNDYTRVVINTSGPVTYREELLEKVGNKPRRLFIDFQDSYIDPRYRSPVPIQDGLLMRIRTGQFSPDTVRVVLDMESVSSYKIFSLPDPFRVVVDVRGQTKEQQDLPAQPPISRQANQIAENSIGENNISTRPVEPGPASTGNSILPVPADSSQEKLQNPPVPVVAESNSISDTDKTEVVVLKDTKKSAGGEPGSSREGLAASEASTNGSPSAASSTKYSAAAPAVPGRQKKLSLAQQLGLGVGKIVIDPGHGGKDPGAIAFGLKEKDIVLVVAKALAKQLETDLNATVILTRDSDTFLPLEERTAIANTSDADLFISLHVNAHPSPQVNGFETYFLNLSTNDEAMRVAARENATSTHQMSDLQDILHDIMQNSKINESSRLAQQVHASIGVGLGEAPFALKDMGIKQAPFYVLIGAEMPAILIELAFISNPENAKLLGNESFIKQLSGKISAGIEHYIQTNTAQL